MTMPAPLRPDGHTPLPWKYVPWHIEEGPSAVRAPEGWLLANTSSDADAEFIVRACNVHYELISALRQAAIQFRAYEQNHLAKKTQDGDEKAYTNARYAALCEAAIARAEGRP